MNVAVKECVAPQLSKATLKAKEKYEGKVFSSRNFGDYTVVKYVHSKEIHIKFLDTEYEIVVDVSRIVVGNIKDNLKPFVCSVGYLGYGYEKNDGLTKVYRTWCSMIKRCYASNTTFRHPTYVDCSVSSEFLNFSYFKKWYFKQVGSREANYQFDKDLLVKGNKVYSPDTCCFIPAEINTLLTTTNKRRGSTPIGVRICNKTGKYRSESYMNGKHNSFGSFNCPIKAFEAYKVAREAYYKEKAEQWKGKISDEAYEALKNRKVEITD